LTAEFYQFLESIDKLKRKESLEKSENEWQDNIEKVDKDKQGLLTRDRDKWGFVVEMLIALRIG
jgi:hypothetical protein